MTPFDNAIVGASPGRRGEAEGREEPCGGPWPDKPKLELSLSLVIPVKKCLNTAWWRATPVINASNYLVQSRASAVNGDELYLTHDGSHTPNHSFL